MWSLFPDSTILPRYITFTRSHMYRIVDRSWEMNMIGQVQVALQIVEQVEDLGLH